MHTNTHMTIQDYFKRFSVSKGISKTPARTGSFAKVLGTALSSTQKKQSGMTIQDYMQRRIDRQSVQSLNLVCPSQNNKNLQVPEKRGMSIGDAQLVGDPNFQIDIPSDTEGGVESSQRSEKDRISHSIDRAATQFDLPEALIRAVIRAESNFNVRAVSPAGAQGLMQLMPATARELGVDNPFDIDQNIQGGAKYLRKMLNQFNGDIELALSAYNAGPGTVIRYEGQVPYPETQLYIRRVLQFVEKFQSSSSEV